MTQRDRGPWVNPIGATEAETQRIGDIVTRGPTFYQSATDGNQSAPGVDTNWAPLGDPIESYLRPTTLKRETFPRSGMAFANVAPPFVTGTMYAQAIPLVAGDLVTNIVFATGTTAAATITHGWYALYDASLHLLRQSTDATTAIAANTLVSKALSSTYQITQSGLYYIAFTVVASTMPTMLGVAPLSTGVTIGTLPRTSFTGNASLTTTAPNPATQANLAFQMYGGIS